MSQPNMIRVKGDGLEIQAAEWPGTGRPVLCVHGLTANCRSFDVAAEGLIPDHRVLAVDLRGRGLSDKPDSGYSIDHHCRDLASVIRELGLAPAALMGHSLGAYIILAFAAKYPELTDRLILVDGGAQLPLEQWAKISVGIKPSTDRLGQEFDSFEDYLAPSKKAPFLQPWSETLENYFRYESEEVNGKFRSRINPAHIQEETTNLLQSDSSQYYDQVRCPVLVLRAVDGMVAEDDHVLPEWIMDDFQKALPQARVVNLAGTNHYSMVLHPNPERDRAVKDFLAG